MNCLKRSGEVVESEPDQVCDCRKCVFMNELDTVFESTKSSCRVPNKDVRENPDIRIYSFWYDGEVTSQKPQWMGSGNNRLITVRNSFRFARLNMSKESPIDCLHDSNECFNELYSKMKVLDDALATVHKELLEKNDPEARAAEKKFVKNGKNADDYAMRLMSMPFSI